MVNHLISQRIFVFYLRRKIWYPPQFTDDVILGKGMNVLTIDTRLDIITRFNSLELILYLDLRCGKKKLHPKLFAVDINHLVGLDN